MKLKKLLAAVVSGLLACSMFSVMPAENSSELSTAQITASAASNFRRVCDNEHPMWIVHIDSWNYADPEKIIELVPEDILPYVVFNVSLSSNWSSTEHKWLIRTACDSKLVTSNLGKFCAEISWTDLKQPIPIL